MMKEKKCKTSAEFSIVETTSLPGNAEAELIISDFTQPRWDDSDSDEV